MVEIRTDFDSIATLLDRRTAQGVKSLPKSLADGRRIIHAHVFRRSAGAADNEGRGERVIP